MKELQELDKQIVKTMEAGYKQSSLDNIKSQYAAYKRFCDYYFLQKFPADIWQLCRFAQYLYNRKISPGTIANSVSTVRTIQALKGMSVPDMNDICIKLELRGIKNLSPHMVRQANCITPQILIKIATVVEFKDDKEMVCFVALLTGFYLLLRKSNLVPETMTGKKVFDGKKQLQRKDLRIGEKTYPGRH